MLADHHTGHYTQRELSKKYECSTATVNRITKGKEPKHTDKVNAMVSVARELSKESEQADRQRKAYIWKCREVSQ